MCNRIYYALTLPPGESPQPSEDTANVSTGQADIGYGRTATPFGAFVKNAVPMKPMPVTGFALSLLVTAIVASLLTLLTVGLARRRSRKRKQRRAIVNGKAAQRGIRLTVGNAHGLGQRENQEDAFGVSDIADAYLCAQRGVLAVVADGMGGLQRGEEVSTAIVASMLNRFPATQENWTPSQVLLHLVYRANEDTVACIDNMRGQCGSTLVAALVQGASLSFVSVGDSRISLYRNGKLLQLNRPHVQAVRADELAAQNGLPFDTDGQSNQRRGLTSYIGIDDLQEIDFNLEPIVLKPGDRILLMTDGVFGTLTEEELARMIGADAQQTAEDIADAIQKMNTLHQDNYTLIVLQICEIGREK